MSKQVWLVFVSLLAVGATAISAPASSATTVHEKSLSGPTYSGNIKAVSDGNLFISAVRFNTLKGDIECSRLELDGALESTGKGKFTAASFTNSGGGSECNTTFSPAGTKAIVSPNLSLLPWPIKITYIKAFEIPMEISGTSVVGLKVEFPSSKLECKYEAASGKLNGSWKNDSEFVTSSEEFVLSSGGKGCPREGELEELVFATVPTELVIGP
jgi:hypothetical protein